MNRIQFLKLPHLFLVLASKGKQQKAILTSELTFMNQYSLSSKYRRPKALRVHADLRQEATDSQLSSMHEKDMMSYG